MTDKKAVRETLPTAFFCFYSVYVFCGKRLKYINKVFYFSKRRVK